MTAEVGGAAAAVRVDFDHIANQGGMLGDTITLARRAGATHLTPVNEWLPAEIEVTAFSAPVRWISQGKEVMNVSITKWTIVFEIAVLCQFYDYGTPGFDGFVLRGFDRRIKSVVLKQNAPLQFELAHDKDEVRVDIRGRTPSGTGFTLHFEFE